MSAEPDDAATDLLIREVDDDLRHEQYLELWRRYGVYAIAVAVLLVAGVAGEQGWLAWRQHGRDQAAHAFAAAEQLAASGKVDEATDAFAKLSTDGPTGVVVAAGMQRAELLARSGNVAAAAQAYDSLAKSGAPQIFRDLATLKSAMLTLDSAEPADLNARVAPLAQASNPWHYAASEILALLALRTGDQGQAVNMYKQLADDLGAPQGIRARAAEMLAILSPAPHPDTSKG